MDELARGDHSYGLAEDVPEQLLASLDAEPYSYFILGAIRAK